ncbi:hypothetical protein AJ80_04604 [Polytolypa hystricis UAMH7299]|uniref:Inositolphosphotransferase Aur1/Ipt1 domain-containing protein n=1 Tax=Polytolypa hystricis (strain UAMH7299) TaxID=1447883 RepID=A0A2B7YAB5_POLH7|nr:hypothetical protein AJ80_04604 [Polytolypa hystricis UAMH7299]
MPNNTSGVSQQWNSKPMIQLPTWGEPLIVFLILFASMVFTRRKHARILRPRGGYLAVPSGSGITTPTTNRPSAEDDLEAQVNPFPSEPYYKRRRICCGSIRTPATTAFSGNIHSRILNKFPFLVEMFYWILTFGFYRMTKAISQSLFSKTGIWDVAQQNGLQVMEIEKTGSLAFLFPWKEQDVQHWFMEHHQTLLTIFNRFYALVHIPGTVGFIAWYYYTAPSHSIFAIVRRTLTLTNLLAFVTFTLYPCMPPRLLPPKYGFLDSVRHDNAQSIWMSGNYVNSLAAMPSMHFGYSFCIGYTLLYHSRSFPWGRKESETWPTAFWKIWYIALGVGYPLSVLITIIATANHYWLDPLAAAGIACLAFFCNRILLVLLPLEDFLCWTLRLEKPAPTTGEKRDSW